MTDENLEKKTRSGLKWGCIIGAVVLATAANGFYAGARYKAGVEEGHKAGVIEGKEAAPNVTIELLPSLMGERAHDMYISVEQNRDGKKVLYHLSADQNAVFADDGTLILPVTNIRESVSITGEGFYMEYMDTDAGYQLGSGPNPRKSCNGKHDGLVDYVINHQSRSTDSNYLLCRDSDYEANRAAFDEADALLSEIKEQYSEQ